MSTERGIGEKTEEEFAWVRSQRKSACAGCSNRSNCSSLSGGNHMLVKVSNPVKAKKGDMAGRLLPVFPEESRVLVSGFQEPFRPVMSWRQR